LTLAANWVTFWWPIPMQQMGLGLKQKTQTENVIGVRDWNLYLCNTNIVPTNQQHAHTFADRLS
jgi:hypothetical protein